VDAPPLAANLRFGPAYVTPDVPTTFDFSADGGIVRAAELCAGIGECRKRGDGTMCPRFQATRDEQHSTRGRANMHRLAMTGQLGLAGLTDPDLRPVLDLCLECKACKSECPTNVDMARIKAEVLHQHHRKHGLPWRNWVFGNVAALSRWSSAWADVSNWLMRTRLARCLNERLLAIDSRRLPPSLAPKTLDQLSYDRRIARFGKHHGRGSIADVWLFPDTFVKYFEPHIGLATEDVLRRLGREVTFGLSHWD